MDFVFETSGVPAALPPALSRLTAGGTAVLIGISAQPLDLTLWTIVYRQLKLVGSLIYDHPGDFAGSIAALEDGTVAPHRVLRPGFPLSATADAFAAVRSTAGKCWIDVTA
ncbi:hypothetical protein ALI22I_14315 [Saccharothrix sp. ALI-22-I]|nr:hypothetical protein ALI22I_14315 [Saccharothrix sp. ALI-22-I]